MAGEAGVEDETGRLRLEMLTDVLEDWRRLWDEAAVRSAGLHPEARDIVARKSSDPHEALRELLPSLAALHPDVIEFVRVSLSMAEATIADFAPEVSVRWDDDGPVADAVPVRSLEDRVSAIETVLQGAGALLGIVRTERPS